MARTARIEFRVEPELKARVVAEADRRGQSLAVFVERALGQALDEGPVVARGPRVPRSEVPPASARASEFALPKIAPRKPR